MDPQAERVARNQAAFRTANEHIVEAAEGLPQAPFLCECPQPDCTVTVWLTLDDYDAVRAHPRHFIAASGHEHNSKPWGHVFDRRDGYVVVEKHGEAGRIAEEMAEHDERELHGRA